MSQFTIMSDIVNDKKDHNIVNDSFADKPDGLLVTFRCCNFKAGFKIQQIGTMN